MIGQGHLEDGHWVIEQGQRRCGVVVEDNYWVGTHCCYCSSEGNHQAVGLSFGACKHLVAVHGVFSSPIHD